MIRSILKTDGPLSVVPGLPAPGQDRQVLWLEINAPTAEESAAVRVRFAIDTQPHSANVIDDGNFLYLRSQLVSLRSVGTFYFGLVTFALGDRIVATLCDDPDFHPFAPAFQRCGRKPSNAENAKAMLRVLLQVANDGASAAIDRIADDLERSASEISAISDGFNEQGKELGVSDLSENMRSLNEKEDLISHCLEAQLSLSRTVRYLGGEVDNQTEAELQGLVTELIGD